MDAINGETTLAQAMAVRLKKNPLVLPMPRPGRLRSSGCKFHRGAGTEVSPPKLDGTAKGGVSACGGTR